MIKVNIMIDKSKLKPGQLLMHRHRGIVKYTNVCDEMEKKHNCDPTSLFVEDMGNIIEISVQLISFPENWKSNE